MLKMHVFLFFRVFFGGKRQSGAPKLIFSKIRAQGKIFDGTSAKIGQKVLKIE